MAVPEFLLFASDATLSALAGGALLALAAASALAERRRPAPQAHRRGGLYAVDRGVLPRVFPRRDPARAGGKGWLAG
jgi:hypothetical protein